MRSFFNMLCSSMSVRLSVTNTSAFALSAVFSPSATMLGVVSEFMLGLTAEAGEE